MYFVFSIDFDIPIFSIKFSVLLIPAVSVSLNLNPFNIIDCSSESLVVPGIFVTIAFSSSRIVLNNVDFPEFGVPSIRILIPSLTRTPFL